MVKKDPTRTIDDVREQAKKRQFRFRHKELFEHIEEVTKEGEAK